MSDDEMRETMVQLRRCAHALAAFGLAVTLSACGSTADTETASSAEGGTLVLALDQSEDHPSFTALDDFADRLSEKTDGRWSIKIYSNETLGSQQDTVQMAEDGSVDLMIASGTLLENLNEDFSLYGAPYFYKSIQHQMSVLRDTDLMSDLYESLEADNGITVLGGFTQGYRNIYTAQEGITEPEDLRGVKLRVQESPLMIDVVRAMGASPTPLSYGEVYTSVQSGIIDGAENNIVSYVTTGHYQVAPHMALTEHQIGTDYLVANTDTLDSMSPADEKVFRDEWDATMELDTELWLKETETMKQTAIDGGATFDKVDEAAFRERLQPVLADMLKDPKNREAYDKVQEHQP